MRSPLNYTGITQKFVKSGKYKHLGIDMGHNPNYGGYNVPVMSADTGVVHSIEFQKTGGWVVWIYHPQYDVATEYGHLRSNSICVKVGDKVNKGQKIAMMGNSGKEYNSETKEWVQVPYHLHFGMQKGKGNKYSILASWLDPTKYLNLYDGQTEAKKTKVKLNHTKKVTAKDGLNIRNKPSVKGKIVRTAKYNEQLENYGKTDGWQMVDKFKKYYASANWLK